MWGRELPNPRSPGCTHCCVQGSFDVGRTHISRDAVSHRRMEGLLHNLQAVRSDLEERFRAAELRQTVFRKVPTSAVRAQCLAGPRL